MEILNQKYKVMMNLHREDDVRILIQLVKEFNVLRIAYHYLNDLRLKILKALKANSVPIYYGPMDSLSDKDELMHDNWRNQTYCQNQTRKFSLIRKVFSN